MRQAGIERQNPVQPRLFLRHVAVGYLGVGMDARIRASGALHMHGPAHDVSKSALDLPLHRGRVGPVLPGLHLPALVMRTHIGNGQFQSGHLGSPCRYRKNIGAKECGDIIDQPVPREIRARESPENARPSGRNAPRHPWSGKSSPPSPQRNAGRAPPACFSPPVPWWPRNPPA